jgi:hypothetical protein
VRRTSPCGALQLLYRLLQRSTAALSALPALYTCSIGSCGALQLLYRLFRRSTAALSALAALYSCSIGSCGALQLLYRLLRRSTAALSALPALYTCSIGSCSALQLLYRLLRRSTAALSALAALYSCSIGSCGALQLLYLLFRHSCPGVATGAPSMNRGGVSPGGSMEVCPLAAQWRCVPWRHREGVSPTALWRCVPGGSILWPGDTPPRIHVVSYGSHGRQHAQSRASRTPQDALRASRTQQVSRHLNTAHDAPGRPHAGGVPGGRPVTPGCTDVLVYWCPRRTPSVLKPRYWRFRTLEMSRDLS